jgi:glycosyltransferase involved in cell wall biosynthesis
VKPKISVVSPVYRAESTVAELVDRLGKALEPICESYEIILVDDGSVDGSWQEIEKVISSNRHVQAYRLSRNFGQHYAITAGLTKARGEWVVVMDCDLQDLPEEIPRLLDLAVSGGFDMVLARRANRQDPFFRRLASRLFYAVFSYFTDTDQDATVANFGVYKDKVVTAILSMGDAVRYFPTMCQWVGFKRGYLDVEHVARSDGGSTYSFRKLVALALSNIVAFSGKPLRLTVSFGLVLSLTSFGTALVYLYRYFSGEIIVMGYASIILSVWFLGGVIISLLGVVGIYVGQTFESVKGRPRYIISESIGSEVQASLPDQLGVLDSLT